MHKIRVIKLKDPNDVGVLNLSKAFAVRKKMDEKESVALAVYYPGAPAEMVFPQNSYKFEFVQIAMNGTVHYAKTDIDTIIDTFTMLD